MHVENEGKDLKCQREREAEAPDKVARNVLGPKKTSESQSGVQGKHFREMG